MMRLFSYMLITSVDVHFGSHVSIGKSSLDRPGKCFRKVYTRARGYKTFFMLNSTEHENFPAHKCYNANNCWHFNIYERKNSILGLSEPKKSRFSGYFCTYVHLKFHAQLS